MNTLLIVIAFYAGMLAWALIQAGLNRLKRQTVAFHTTTCWREVELVSAEDIAEATLRWHKAIGVQGN